MNTRFVLRILSLLLFIQSCTMWPMQSGSTVSQADQEKIEQIIEQVKNQMAQQPQIDAAELVARIKAQIGEDPAVAHNPTIFEMLANLEKDFNKLQQSRNNNKADSIKTVEQEFLDVMDSFKLGNGASLQKERAKVMDLNTVLLGHPKFPIALYKRDILTLPFMAFDVMIAHWAFKMYKQCRIDYLYKTLTQNAEQFITWFTEITTAEQDLKTKNLSVEEKKELFNKIEENSKKITEACDYVGSNPFKIDLLFPLFATIAGHKASSYVRKQIMTVNSVLPEAYNAYTKKSDGTYERFLLDPMYGQNIAIDKSGIVGVNFDSKTRYQTNPITGRYEMVSHEPAKDSIDNFKQIGSYLLGLFFFNRAPMSVTRAATYPVNNPNMILGADYLPDPQVLKPSLDALNKFGYKLMGLPDWFYKVSNSPVTSALIELAVLGQAIILIDTLYSGTWNKALDENRDKLITLLRNYQVTSKASNTSKEKQSASAQLKQFIAQQTVMPSWRTACKDLYKYLFTSRGRVDESIVAWSFVITLSALLLKSRPLLKAGYGPLKNNMIPLEVGLIFGFYGLIYFGIPFTVAATRVCKDIWHMGKKAINFFKKKTNKSDKSVPIGGSL